MGGASDNLYVVLFYDIGSDLTGLPPDLAKKDFYLGIGDVWELK